LFETALDLILFFSENALYQGMFIHNWATIWDKIVSSFSLNFREENISQIVPEKRAQGQKTYNHIPRSKHLDEAN
jgi:hypothetical protein